LESDGEDGVEVRMDWIDGEDDERKIWMSKKVMVKRGVIGRSVELGIYGIEWVKIIRV
jgi:hypothetical protein